MTAARGMFIDGPLIGAEYATSSGTGLTEADGGFSYQGGEKVTFSIGGVVVGSGLAQEFLTAADLSNVPDLRAPGVTNRARLLHSLATDLDITEGIVVTPVMRDALVRSGQIDFDCDEATFGKQLSVRTIVELLGIRLRSGAEARNHLRRSIAGIKKETDVRVPLRDGSHLLADVFRPIHGGRHPVLLGLSVYGRATGIGSICDEADRVREAVREDEWFNGPRTELPATERYAENFVRANSLDWVPRGYVCVRLDPRGVGRTPGVIQPYSTQEAVDYYDAIAWAAAQPWSDGNVGLFGASYAATVQWNVARLKPPALRAMMPWACDVDSYRELAYPGGILHEGHRRTWWESHVAPQKCGDGQSVDFIGGLEAHPFDDDDYYGADGSGPLTADLEQSTVPFLTSVSQAYILHSRGGFEAFTRARAAFKRLIVVDGNYHSFLYEDCLEQQRAFFDHYLKDTKVDVGPPVRLVMRTGNGEFEWIDAEDWPIPGTRYERLYFDAHAAVGGEGLLLTPAAPDAAGDVAYSADVDPASRAAAASGVSFVSEPLDRELELAGHVGATLWVSASTHDMDVFVAVRVIAPDGSEVRYPVRAPKSVAPLTYGCLKVSQRALDPERSTIDRPWHTHRRSDRAPLAPGEIACIEVELMPMTARVPRGHRLRVDIQPVEGGFFPDLKTGIAKPRAYDRSYHDGARNTVHTGASTPSSLRLPVIGHVAD